MHRQRRSGYILKSLILVPLSFCLNLALPLCAQEQAISQMVHTSWTGVDGAPQGITALAQTPDGILWIGAIAGLFSFDGVTFTAFSPKTNSPPLATSNVDSLFVSKQGDLCVFWFHGPPACIHEGVVRFIAQTDDEPIDVLSPVQQDSGGTFWAALNEQDVVRLGSDNIWHKVANPTAGTGHISEVFHDSRKTLWVIENDLLYRRAEGESAFAATDIHVYGPARIVESQDQSLWVMGGASDADDAVNLQHIDRLGRRLSAPVVHGQINTILVTPDKSLWIDKDQALQRFTARTIPGVSGSGRYDSDLYPLKNGPTEWDLQGLFSDADGNIWVGGMGGLDRFERANLVSAIPDAKVGYWHSCVDVQGEVWVVNADDQMFLVKDGQSSRIHKWGGTSNVLCGEENRLYVLDANGISVVQNRHIRHLPVLPGFTGYGDHYQFRGMIEQPGGDLIAASGGATGHGLWKYSAGKWSRYLPNLTLPELCGMLMDTKGRLYLGFVNSVDQVGRIEGGSLTILNGSGALSFSQTSYGVFAYGGKGIAIDRGNRFQRFSFLHPDQGKKITGVVESRSGDLWINGARGIVRIPAAEVRAAIADPTHAVVSVNLQEGNFVGPDITLVFRNSAHIDLSGRLWFSTMNGVVSVDPDHLAAPQRPPLLSIRSIVADGHAIDANATFPPDTHTLDFKYFGVDLTDPRRVVYRYRLAGLGSDSHDSSWQDVGTRTEATYTHLPPGSYRFQVIASNGNDIWTQPVSSVIFRILPHFYQRPWVQGLFVLAAVLLAWAAISLRVRYVSSAIRIRAEERADERIRIARELHDTLLQGVQGLLLNFHVAAQKVAADHESKEALEKALTTADRIIVEGRNRVNRLRSENLTDAELESLIEGVAANLNSIAAIDCAVERKGETNTLQGHVVDEVFCIAREAMTNAYRHSGASTIVVELDYQKREFRMTCRDNGRGFDIKALGANETNGHWGLRGMAERAERIGADFFYDSAVNGGTKVCLIVPARRAYQRRGRFRFFSRRQQPNTGSEITT
jgi:signal transduction histidine kinase/ligand-binding sensor domain-containing protein